MKKVLFNVLAGIVAVPSAIGTLIGAWIFFASFGEESDLLGFIGVQTGLSMLVGGSLLLMFVIFMHELFSKSYDGNARTVTTTYNVTAAKDAAHADYVRKQFEAQRVPSL